MSRALVTMAEAVAALRLDADSAGQPDDADHVRLLIEAASRAVLAYLKDQTADVLDSAGDVLTDSSGDPAVPEDVRLAVLYLVGYYYRNRDADDGEIAHGYPPRPVVALLHQRRDPALA